LPRARIASSSSSTAGSPREDGGYVTWRDAIALSARSVGRRLGRAALTVLAVGLAAALLSSLLIASTAAQRRVLDQVSDGGPLAGIRVAAAAPNVGALDSDDPPTGEPRSIDDEALGRIEALGGVTSVVPVLAHPVLLVPPAEPLTDAEPRRRDLTDAGTFEPYFDTMVGADLSRAGDLPVAIVSGRLPFAESSTEAAVTVGYLRRLGLPKERADEVIGTELVLGEPRAFTEDDDQRIRGRWVRMQIVGVVAQEIGSGQVLVPLDEAQRARAWTLAGDATDIFDVLPSPYTALFVVADGLDRVPQVRQAITDVGYATSAPETLIESVQRYLRIVEIVLAGIGFIALAIAALGISNAMLASVRERRREIGVLKAVGASDRDVRRIFLVEAGTLGFLGGVVGTVVGYFTAQVLAAVVNDYLRSQRLETVQLGLPWFVAVAVIGGATLLALAAGTLPAQHAARLPARQAMGDR
jgi:putative ABC transport system permease protein